MRLLSFNDEKERKKNTEQRRANESFSRESTPGYKLESVLFFHIENRNMDDSEFDQVPQILFDGVPSLERFGSPGTLIPLTNDTRAVLAGADSNNIIIVATRFGHGRCLVFAHNSYPSMFLNIEEKHQTFVENCRKWLARGHAAEFLCIDQVQAMHEIATHGKILVWDGHHAKSDAFMKDLVRRHVESDDVHPVCSSLVRFLATWRFSHLCHDCLGLDSNQ